MDQSKVLTAVFVLSLESWKALHFTAAELQDETISGDPVDLDGDGLTAVWEYLHGTDPRDSGSRGVKHTTLQGGYFSMIFIRRQTGVPGISIRAVGSRDGANWDAPGPEERVLSTVDGVETVEARLPTTAGTGLLGLCYGAAPGG